VTKLCVLQSCVCTHESGSDLVFHLQTSCSTRYAGICMSQTAHMVAWRRTADC
jgi:hypothetical protein